MIYCKNSDAYALLQGPDLPRPPSMVLGEAPKMCLYSHMFYKIYKGEYFSILTHPELSPTKSVSTLLKEVLVVILTLVLPLTSRAILGRWYSEPHSYL